MKLKQILSKYFLITIMGISTAPFVYASDNNIKSTLDVSYFPINNTFSLSINQDDWVRKPLNQYSSDFNNSSFYKTPIKHKISDGNKISMAWDFTNFLSVNLNVFENNLNKDFYLINNNRSLNQSENYFDQSISGYQLGLSSEVNLWRNYKLGLNVDYGQVDGADLIGFNNNEINTTSFGLGVRNSHFGASINTDVYLQDNINMMEDYRIGFEFFWFFSDSTSLSVGSKQRMNNNIKDQNHSLDDLTGNIQYIKFQRNL